MCVLIFGGCVARSRACTCTCTCTGADARAPYAGADDGGAGYGDYPDEAGDECCGWECCERAAEEQVSQAECEFLFGLVVVVGADAFRGSGRRRRASVIRVISVRRRSGGGVRTGRGRCAMRVGCVRVFFS